ncbi:MAG TPA: magnesium transporter CorA family protein [Nitrososphaeraceae archaeon]
MKTIISYNEHEIRTDGSIDDLGNGYNVWIDLVDPNHEEIMGMANKFSLDPEALETYFNKSKKPEIRVLDNHTFTVILDMKNKDPKTLETEGIYMFLGRHWLLTAHGSEVKLKEIVERLLKVKNKKIKEAQIDALYYNLLAEIIGRYEQLLTAVELSVNEYQRRSFARPSEVIFDEIDTLSRQTIILRRHFWRVRNIINFLVHNEHDKEEIKYIEMVYDDISQLIDFAESYEGTINSIRELYVAKVSLQINDTMRVLTIFTVILLPLTLIAGIYGMNGVDINKLESLPMGFILVTLMMAIIGIGLLAFFIKKRWLWVREKKGNETVHEINVKEQKNRNEDKKSHITYTVFKKDDSD